MFRRYDALGESWRMLTMLAILLVFLTLGLVIRLTVSEGIGWVITIVPLFTLIGLRRRYLRRLS